MPTNCTVCAVSFTTDGAHTPDQLEFIKQYNGGNYWLSYDAYLQAWTHVALHQEGAPAYDYTERVLVNY